MGLNGEANHVAYCTSKGAVVQMTRCLRSITRATIFASTRCVPRDTHQMVDDILATHGEIPGTTCRSSPPAFRCGASPRRTKWARHPIPGLERSQLYHRANCRGWRNDATGVRILTVSFFVSVTVVADDAH